MQVIEYSVVSKATVEHGGDAKCYAVKLLYKGDGTPWQACSAGLELPVSSALFQELRPGDTVTLTVAKGGK